MEAKKKRINKQIIILAAIITTIFIISVATGITLAKYQDGVILSKETQIAKPIFIVEGGEASAVNAVDTIGYYNFTIKNYDENQISDVGFKYNIEIISKANDAIKFKLFDENNQEIELKNNKTADIKINRKDKEKEERNYKLQIIYEKDADIEEKDIIEQIQVKVHSEQQKI